MRREDRKISKSEVNDILNKAEYGVLSMVTPDNEGYGVPLNFVIKENNLYFHCAPEGSKLDYLRINNKVSFCAVGNTKLLPEKFGTIYESVIVNGTTSEIEGDEKKQPCSYLLINIRPVIFLKAKNILIVYLIK